MNLVPKASHAFQEDWRPVRKMHVKHLTSTTRNEVPYENQDKVPGASKHRGPIERERGGKKMTKKMNSN